jgi:Xaa-Pro aminopeptidase
MTTERVAVRVSDAEMNRRWDAVRKLMRERGIQALIAYHTEDWLGGHARWFTDIPTHNGYGRTVVFHADDLMTIVQQGNFGGRRKPDGKDPYHRGVGEFRFTPFFSSVRYTTSYHAEIVRELIKERGYKTIGFVLPETMPHKLVNGIVEGFDGLKVIDITEQIDRLIAIKGPDELDLLRRSAVMQDKVFEKVVKEI